MVASDLWANVSFLASWWRRQASGAVGVKASLELLWLCGARRELCRAVAKPQGLATHLHVSFCLLEDADGSALCGWNPACAGPLPRTPLPLLTGPSPDLFGFRNLPCPAMFLP